MPVIEWLDFIMSRLSDTTGVERSLVVYTGFVVALAVLCFFLALRHFIGVHGQAADRLDVMLAMQRAEEEAARARRKQPGLISRIINRMSLARGIERDLERADLALSVPEYMLIVIGLVALGVLVGYIRGSLLLSAMLAILAILLMRVWLSGRASSRRKAFAKQLNDMINLMVGALRAGYGVLQAMNVVVGEMPPPASQEIGRIVRQVQLGLPLSVALDNSVERIQNDDWAFIVTSINIQAEVGGNLAEILQTVGDTIRERVRIVGEIRVLTTQQRLTGWILSLLPVFLLVVMFIISPDYMRGLPIALGLMGAAGIIVGAMLLRRIVDIEV